VTSLRTIPAKAAEKIARAAASLGVEPTRLYEAAGFDPALLDDPDSRVPFAQIVKLYEEAARLSGDDAFGLHVGEQVDPTVFDVLGYSVINSPTFGDALDRVVRYNSLWTNGSGFTVEHDKSLTTVTYAYFEPIPGERRQDCEMTLAALAVLGRRVTNTEWAAREVRFQHARPADTGEHDRIFRCPLRFNAPANELVFDSAYLDLRIVKADPNLCAVLDRHAGELLAKYPREDSFLERVRAIMKNEFKGGEASLERIAEQVGLSSRTLQRKLHELGTSHQELLDQMRKELAMRYLREPEMAICEVAYLLGFSESSALHRAFKRWTGKTPSEFRRG
jgi:AraC-like DNA-binding protein